MVKNQSMNSKIRSIVEYLYFLNKYCYSVSSFFSYFAVQS